MSPGAHWWSEPPLWAWIVMIVGAVSIAILLPVALSRGAPAPEAATGGSASTASDPRTSATPTSGGPTSGTPKPSSTSATSTSATSTSATSTKASPTTRSAGAGAVLIIGEGDTAGPKAWPALLRDRLDDAVGEVAADPGAGYVEAGPTGRVMQDLVRDADLSDAEVVVVYGSRNDGSGIADQVAVAAQRVFEGISAAAPDAALVVVGPTWPDAAVPAGVRNNRDVIRAEAVAVGATFVDPLEDRWFLDEPGLVGDDGATLTPAGQEYVADRIEPLLSRALAAG